MSELEWIRSTDYSGRRGYEFEASNDHGNLVFLVYSIDTARRKWVWHVTNEFGRRIYFSAEHDNRPHTSARAARAAAEAWLTAREGTGK